MDFPKKIVQNTLASSSGAGGGTRTPTPSLAADFESATSTNSITPAGVENIIHNISLLGKSQNKIMPCNIYRGRFAAVADDDGFPIMSRDGRQSQYWIRP